MGTCELKALLCFKIALFANYGFDRIGRISLWNILLFIYLQILQPVPTAKSVTATTATRGLEVRTQTFSAMQTPAWTRWRVCGVPRQATKWLLSHQLFRQQAASIIWELSNTSLEREFTTLTTLMAWDYHFTQVWTSYSFQIKSTKCLSSTLSSS